tara:strand:+ start:436 stop:819 length:384 start_codon:yes stop_codon:yes gene_type:complete
MAQIPALSGGRSLVPPANHGVQNITMADTTQLRNHYTTESNEFQVQGEILVVDPTGNRELRLPPEASAKGMTLNILNAADGSETITLKADAGNALSIAGSIAIDQNEMAYCVCDGVEWYASILKATT